MRSFANRAGFEVKRRVKAFLNPDAEEDGGADKVKDVRQQLREARRDLAKQEREISGLRAKLDREMSADAADHGISPENVVWVFGSGRTGSSWLTFMMGALPDHTRWNEPLVGNLFGTLYYERAEPRQDKKHFILADDYRENWHNSIRSLVLGGGAERFPERMGGGYLVIKEPHGSIGAPLLMEAMPESRMIFLIRDPRDVVASAIKVSYVPKTRRSQAERIKKAERNPKEFAWGRALTYLNDIELTRRAYDAHAGHKTLVRYEDLRADTMGSMKRIYAELDIPVDEEKLERAVKARLWENVPEEKKGEGKIRRKAKPGGWKEDLTKKQVEIVEREAADILERFYKES